MASEPWLDRHIFNESEMALFSECMLCVLKKCLIPPALFESRCFANSPSSVYKIGHFSGADCDIIDNVKARKLTLNRCKQSSARLVARGRARNANSARDTPVHR